MSVFLAGQYKAPTQSQPAGEESIFGKISDTFKNAVSNVTSTVESITVQNMLKNGTPDQFFDTLAVGAPDWKGVVAQIKQDKALENATFTAFKNDPTMLSGFTGFMGGGEKADPKEAEKFLQDPLNRRGLTEVMKKIGDQSQKDENGNDKYTFKDFNELYEDRNNREKTIKKLNSMGINPMDSLTGEDMWGMVKSFFNDPQGFMKGLPAMMGMSGAQGEAMGKLLGGLGAYVELVIGGEHGYRAFFNEHGNDMYNTGSKFFNDISGQTDEELKTKGGLTKAQVNAAENNKPAAPEAPAPAAYVPPRQGGAAPGLGGHTP